MSRPQIPEILTGFRDTFWSLAMRTLMGAKSVRKVAQHSSRPQQPTPPTIFASSRTPIWRISMRVWNCRARSRTNSRKSTRPSEAK